MRQGLNYVAKKVTKRDIPGPQGEKIWGKVKGKKGLWYQIHTEGTNLKEVERFGGAGPVTANKKRKTGRVSTSTQGGEKVNDVCIFDKNRG